MLEKDAEEVPGEGDRLKKKGAGELDSRNHITLPNC